MPMNRNEYPISVRDKAQDLGNELSTYLNELISKSHDLAVVMFILGFLGISRPFIDKTYERIYEFESNIFKGGMIFDKWKAVWTVLTKNDLYYVESNTSDAADKIDLFHFDASSKVQLTNITKDKLILKLTISKKPISLQINDTLHGIITLHYLAVLLKNSIYCHINRFQSFAPIRNNNECEFYVDGEFYFRDVYESIEKASKYIMITDWWFSPEMPF